jgi:[phosphatase 2A protein]-leucine-carboxy methyltransferase
MFPPDRFNEPSASDADAAVRATDGDAALARYSAVNKGYLADPYALALAPRGARLQPPRPPLIHVGTHARVWALDYLVNSFLDRAQSEGKKVQIVSLGAGSDTRFWRLSVRLHISRCTVIGGVIGWVE